MTEQLIRLVLIRACKNDQPIYARLTTIGGAVHEVEAVIDAFNNDCPWPWAIACRYGGFIADFQLENIDISVDVTKPLLVWQGSDRKHAAVMQ